MEERTVTRARQTRGASSSQTRGWPGGHRGSLRVAPDKHSERGTAGGAGQGSARGAHAGDLYSQAGCSRWPGFPDGR